MRPPAARARSDAPAPIPPRRIPMIQRLARTAARTLALLLLALPALAPAVRAEVPARERQQLARAAAVYGQLRSYRLEGVFAVESSVEGETQKLDAPVRIAG